MFYFHACMSLLYILLVSSERWVPLDVSQRWFRMSNVRFANTVRFYNLLQVAFNSYLFLAILHGYHATPVPHSSSWWHELERWTGLSQTTLSWQVHTTQMYLVAKYVDWIDTLIIVLKKSRRQLSWLHCLHHLIMPWPVYAGMTVWPDVMILYTYQNAMNSFVHVLMYGYYFVHSLFPRIEKYKLLLTEFQLFQFFSCMVVAAVSMTKPDFHWFGWSIYMAISLLMIRMFASFYAQDRKKPGRVHVLALLSRKSIK